MLAYPGAYTSVKSVVAKMEAWLEEQTSTLDHQQLQHQHQHQQHQHQHQHQQGNVAQARQHDKERLRQQVSIYLHPLIRTACSRQRGGVREEEASGDRGAGGTGAPAAPMFPHTLLSRHRAADGAERQSG